MKYESMREVSEFIGKVVPVDKYAGGEDLLKWIMEQMVGDADLSLWPLEGDGSGFCEYLNDRGQVQRQRLGRYVTRNYPAVSDMRERSVQQIIDAVMSAVAYNERDFRIMDGDEAKTEIYEDTKWGGCLAGRPARKATLWFWENGVKALIHNNKVRTLLWTDAAGKQMIDIMYPNDGTSREAYRMWAACNDALICDGQGKHGVAEHRNVYEVGADDESVPYHVEMNFPTNGMVPFVDTLNHGLVNRKTEKILLFASYPKTDDGERWYPDDSGDWERMHFYSQGAGLDGSLLHPTRHCGCGLVYAPKFLGGTDTACGDCIKDMATCERDNCEKMLAPNDMHTVHTKDGQQKWCYDCYVQKATDCWQCERRGDSANLPDSWLLDEDDRTHCAHHVVTNTCTECDSEYMCGEGMGTTVGVGGEHQYPVCDQDCKTALVKKIDNLVIA